MSLSIASNIFVLIPVYYSLFLQLHFDFQVLQFLTLESQFFDRQFLINLKISLLVFDTIHFLISPILAFQYDNFGTLLITEYGLS